MSLRIQLGLSCLIAVATAAAPQYFFVKQSLTWLEALSYCRSQYTDLVSTLSDLELYTVSAVTMFNEAWIGYHLCNPGSWRWSNGATGAYTRWNLGEPSQVSNACVRVIGGKWSDADCGSRYYFMCYKLLDATVPELPSTCQWPLKPTTPGSLSTGGPDITAFSPRWSTNSNQDQKGPGSPQITPVRGTSPRVAPGTSSESSDSSDTPAVSSQSPGTAGSPMSTAQEPTSHDVTNATEMVSLHLVLTPMTWAESRSYCRQHHTDLAVVSIPEEQSTISVLLSGMTSGGKYWIGLRQNRFWGHWYWSGGHVWGNSTAWGAGEPQDPLSQACGLLSAGDLRWNSACCGERLPFVCYEDL
ncbi:macrophage mannose receptor 1-like [Spea bombifrons]|uniref:macrophage mannose receptor 1-like n=1 Tax=Spea bombifrons TaxID=233779 RepID=UPI00234A475A|nr:macrophage mannose receptor 1-like [Spea bombifrons]